MSRLWVQSFFLSLDVSSLGYNLILSMSHLWVLTSFFVKPQINVASLGINFLFFFIKA